MSSNINQTAALRIWPGIVIVALQWVLRFIMPYFAPELQMYWVISGVFGGTLLLLIWWIFFSKASWAEKFIALGIIVLVMALSPLIMHKSISTGAMGMLFYILAIPVVCLALVIWAVAIRKLSLNLKYATLSASVFIACGIFALLRTGGFTGMGENDFAWRWSATPEEELLAESEGKMSIQESVPKEMIAEADWPGFRGPNRNGVIHGVQIKTDWSENPPQEVWRRPVGPGWSSFAVGGDFFYTQEQRGEEEVVSCYNITTGEPVWMHADKERFWESNAGAGPRGTPTLSNGRLYSLGATGILNALNASDGSVIWSRNAAKDTGANLPGWAFSSSPLAMDSLVYVAVSGALAVYHADTGELKWKKEGVGDCYSSPQFLSIDNVHQILQLNGKGLSSYEPEKGGLLWHHNWGGYPIVQPAITVDGDILISVEAQSGLRRLNITQSDTGWAVSELWTSNRLKPYYSDFVVHNNLAFGIDGSILACIELNEGKRMWKGGRYGPGQIFLLADQDMLLVLGEKGELALVSATGNKFNEVAKIPAIQSKTWNHPALVGDILLIRNAEEMAAFRLSLISTDES